MADELERVDGERRTSYSPSIGRRRVLGVLSGALFGLAAKVFVPMPAGAAHLGCPSLCNCIGTVGQCHTCSGATCTQCPAGSFNCETQNKQCWTVTTPAGGGCYNTYRCCDWLRTDNTVCICRGYLGVICPSRPVAQPAA